MKRDLFVISFFSAITLLVFLRSFSNFFTQDDFILISHFSQNGFFADIKTIFERPTINHFRPVHNLFFLGSGYLFGTNYLFYHLFMFFVHIISGFFVYKVFFKISSSKIRSAAGGLIYLVSPIHFVSLFWISGGATIIGFLFLITSFYSYLKKNHKLFFILYLISILASEAMVVGIIIFFTWNVIIEKKLNRFLILIGVFSLIFIILRTTYFSSTNTSNDYNLIVSSGSLSALKYYVLKIFGFADTNGLLIVKTLWLVFTALIFSLTIQFIRHKQDLELLMFSLSVVLAGFFPFILIPNHLSSHYMNISVFGLALLFCIVTSKLKTGFIIFIVFAYFVLSILDIKSLENSHWVTVRSKLSKTYIASIEEQNLPNGSLIVFEDTEVSTSKEAYIVLGTGKALGFWFKDKDYKSCFTFYENCFQK